MKRFIFFYLIVLSIFSLNAQNYIEFNPSEIITPISTVVLSNDTIVEFTVIIPGMYDTPIDSFNRINIKEHVRLDSVGFPEIPIVSFLVAIPDCDSINLKIKPLDSTLINGYNIYPAPEMVPDTTPEGYKYLREEFVYDQTAYSTDSYFPGIISETIDRGAVRSQQCIRVLFYPVQFNPVSKSITVYSEVKISLVFTNPTGPVNNNVGIFNEMLSNSLINYESNGLNASVSCGVGVQQEGDVHWVTTLMPGERVNENCDYLMLYV
ncbi:MAG: C25 family peptidase propeptide domain-containing protein [Bacteroidales bacterium]